jgi:transcriptional regulator with XRE-family HTH domain
MFLDMHRMTTPDPALGVVLRRFRETRGLPRETLAFSSGITTGSLARIELSQSVPGWNTVRQIAEALGISLVALAEAVEAEQQSNCLNREDREARPE